MAGKKKDLVQIIRDNPGCVAFVDNDSWQIRKPETEPEGFDDWGWEEQDKWLNARILVSSRDQIKPIGEHGSGCIQDGIDILHALAEIVGITIQHA